MRTWLKNPPQSVEDYDIARSPLLFMQETIHLLPQVEPFYANNRPDIMLYDFVAWTGRILAAKQGVPAIQLCPTFAANEHWSMDQEFVIIDPAYPTLAEFGALLYEFLSAQNIRGISAETFFTHIERQHLVFLP